MKARKTGGGMTSNPFIHSVPAGNVLLLHSIKRADTITSN